MLSLFPELLFLAPFSALLVRVALAALFAHVAWRRLNTGMMLLKYFAALDGLIALALFFGFFTQLAALAAALCIAAWFFVSTWRPVPVSTVLLALIMAFSLILTGPGPFGFDLPL